MSLSSICFQCILVLYCVLCEASGFGLLGEAGSSTGEGNRPVGFLGVGFLGRELNDRALMLQTSGCGLQKTCSVSKNMSKHVQSD